MITHLSLPCFFSSLRRLAAMAVVTTLLTVANGAHAQQRYKTADAAVTALIDAVRAGAPALMVRVLGPGSDDVVLSGDQVADAIARKRFLDAYDAKHQIMPEGEDKALLIVGQEEWPFPIPLLRRNNTWRFDAQGGHREILIRRIGRNELSAIQACLAYVDAQQEYADKAIGGSGVYARRIVSRSGHRDGLYWPAEAGENESPLGEFAARAATDGYQPGAQRIPYHGYYFKILTRQGSNASGGVVDYLVRGKMIGGFALVAYPAKYRNSGVMTFIVNHQGVIYEKDLGWRTNEIAPSITTFDPDHTWQRVPDTVQSP